MPNLSPEVNNLPQGRQAGRPIDARQNDQSQWVQKVDDVKERVLEEYLTKVNEELDEKRSRIGESGRKVLDSIHKSAKLKLEGGLELAASVYKDCADSDPGFVDNVERSLIKRAEAVLREVITFAKPKSLVLAADHSYSSEVAASESLKALGALKQAGLSDYEQVEVAGRGSMPGIQYACGLDPTMRHAPLAVWPQETLFVKAFEARYSWLPVKVLEQGEEKRDINELRRFQNNLNQLDKRSFNSVRDFFYSSTDSPEANAVKRYNFEAEYGEAAAGLLKKIEDERTASKHIAKALEDNPDAELATHSRKGKMITFGDLALLHKAFPEKFSKLAIVTKKLNAITNTGDLQRFDERHSPNLPIAVAAGCAGAFTKSANLVVKAGPEWKTRGRDNTNLMGVFTSAIQDISRTPQFEIGTKRGQVDTRTGFLSDVSGNKRTSLFRKVLAFIFPARNVEKRSQLDDVFRAIGGARLNSGDNSSNKDFYQAASRDHKVQVRLRVLNNLLANTGVKGTQGSIFEFSPPRPSEGRSRELILRDMPREFGTRGGDRVEGNSRHSESSQGSDDSNREFFAKQDEAFAKNPTRVVQVDPLANDGASTRERGGSTESLYEDIAADQRQDG